MESKTLVIWFKDGKTALFEQVENFDSRAGVISFESFGVRTETQRKATFLLANIAGFAIEQ
ncbi:hypothetical protein R6Z02_00140 [Carnobacterium maltaromaticum]|uniref:hypothetical protein n=1 Tax=Carnobacterium maltaromaticum TaxID=2751 RepID=UPI00298B5FDB|nr:hypothetical protein [Carnobacterium maltaromaticum]MDW5522140.1 hypothetical protein [Carnobacterium maltaromaticum]